MGGIQFDIYKPYNLRVKFCAHDGGELDLYKTPRELGLKPGTVLCMTPTSE